MSLNNATIYFKTTSSQVGALGIFQVMGPEASLHHLLDSRLAGKKNQGNPKRMGCKELRYGWLVSELSDRIDEVMLAKPGEGMRVLMIHGSKAIADAVDEYMRRNGATGVESIENLQSHGFSDPLLDPVLSACITEAQVAAVLAARETAAERGVEAIFPRHLLATHQLLVVGPPNAGKSSLMNQLAGYQRAFVHAAAGATRDIVDELVDLGGFAVLVSDLPGYSRHWRGVDALAWEKAAGRLRRAEAVLFVCDSSVPWDGGTADAAAAVADLLRPGCPVMVLANKSDLPRIWDGEPWRVHFPHAVAVEGSSLPDGDAREHIAASIASLYEPGA